MKVRARQQQSNRSTRSRSSRTDAAAANSPLPHLGVDVHQEWGPLGVDVRQEGKEDNGQMAVAFIPQKAEPTITRPLKYQQTSKFCGPRLSLPPDVQPISPSDVGPSGPSLFLSQT